MAGSGRLVDYLGAGVASSRPATLTLVSGGLGFYWATDTTTLSMWDGSAWANLSSGGMSNPMTAVADIIVGGASGAPTRLSGGTDGYVLTMVSGAVAWAASASGFANPMTTAGDMIIGGGAGAPARFAAPTTGTTWNLTYVIGTGYVWSSSAASVAWGGITGTLSSQTDLVASLLTAQSQLVGINDQTGTSYTLVLGDAGKDVRCNNASAITLTVPPNSSVAFPIGTLIAFSQNGAGAVTATAGSGVTINAANGAATTAQYDSRVLEKTDTNTWRVW